MTILPEYNYSAMNNLMLDLLRFCEASLIKEKNEIKQSKEELQKNIDSIKASGQPVSDKLIEAQKAKRTTIVSLNHDIKYVENLINGVSAIISSTTDDKSKNVQINNYVRGFFVNYNNLKSTSGIVDIKKGESQFNEIIAKTKVYGKYQTKIDEINKQLQNIIGKRNINVNNKESMLEKDLKYRVGRLKNKQLSMSNQQKMIMIYRQSAISKRNAKVAKMDAKVKTAMVKGHTFREKFYKKRLEKLKKKDIKVKSARSILFKERFIAFVTERKYDEKGNFETRTWDQRRLDALEKKSKRKL